MSRVLVINPNCSTACSAGIDAALAPFRLAGGPVFEVATLAEGVAAARSSIDEGRAAAALEALRQASAMPAQEE